MKLDNDKLFSVPARQTVQAAYGSLSANQHEQPAVQVMAAAVLFKVLAEELCLDISQLLSSAARLIKHDDNPYRAEVAALREYVKGELK